MKDQNGFAWPKAFFTENSRKVSVNVSYNEESLNQRISQLSCLQTEQTPAENAKPEFDGNQYVIKPEVYGNAVDKERLTEQVKSYHRVSATVGYGGNQVLCETKICRGFQGSTGSL